MLVSSCDTPHAVFGRRLKISTQVVCITALVINLFICSFSPLERFGRISGWFRLSIELYGLIIPNYYRVYIGEL